jgi:subtilisin family serine protease
MRLRFATLCALTALAGCSPENTEPNSPRDAANPVVPEQAVTTSSDTVPALADALIRTSARHSNHGSAQTMIVKITQSQDDSTRVVIKFDQAAIAAAIGSGTLTRATLELGIEQSGTESENRLDAHRLVLPWTESGVTWRCGIDLNLANVSADCPTTKWRMSGPDMDAFVAARTDRAHLNPGQTGVAKFNVTADVQAFLGGAVNHGWLVMAANATSRAVVWSRETAVKPRLVLAVERNSVPPEAPGGEPAGLYRTAVMVPVSPNSPVKVVRDALSILFKQGTTQADRAAVVSRIQGTVIGGTHITDTDGFYIVQVPDPGTMDSLERIVASLDTAVAVDLAMPEYTTSTLGSYRLPNDGETFLKQHFGLRPQDARGAPWYLTAVNAPLAWGCSTGSDNTPIAMVDEHIFFFGSGVPDLTPTITFHTNKFPGGQHGVRVASILAARGDNQQGMTGMMWQSDLRLYDIVELDPQTGQPNIDSLTHQPALNPRGMANRISQAIRDGARIINLSMGIPYPDHTPTRDDTLNARRWVAAVQRTWSRFPAGDRPLLVIAAGNDGVDAWWSSYPQMETHFPNEVIVVGGGNRAGNGMFIDDGETSNVGPLVSVVAPAEEMVGFNGLGVLEPFGRTSAATPLVSGTAGLLLAFDPRLTTPQLHDLVMLGAQRSGRSIGEFPMIDAYESLKEAGQRPGAPLCGNRIWANAGLMNTNRSNGAEALFAHDGGERGVFALAAHHGGREIDMIAWGGPDRTFKLSESGEWFRSEDPTQLFANQSGVANSLWGLSHDGDQEVFIDISAFNSSRIVRMKLFDSTGATTLTAPDMVLDQLQQYPETTCAWRSRGACGGIGRGTNDEYYLPWAVAYSPMGDHAVLAVSVRRHIATFNGDWKPCPWSVPDPETGDPSDECLDSITNENLPVRAYLYDFPLPSGAPRLITTLNGTGINSVAISEDGRVMIVNEGMKSTKYDALPPGPEGCYPDGQPGIFGFCITENYSESNATCSVTYRSLSTGAVIEPRIPALYACGLPVGATAAVKANSGMKPRSLRRP